MLGLFNYLLKILAWSVGGNRMSSRADQEKWIMLFFFSFFFFFFFYKYNRKPPHAKALKRKKWILFQSDRNN
jgi:hypothetical protein